MREVKVNVLGTEYTLSTAYAAEDPRLANKDGYCDASVKKCVVDEMGDADPDAKADLGEYRRQVARHELIHAFLFESGLEGCCTWGSEEMVDWLAIQFPKMAEAFKEAGCL